ncbi:uncharacterized protein LOC122385551 [Amphibalanus amphitrite]|uniref:uncharacterized protein LOC122385551 n=1 Tax=Amphibalanus amphitrite TaxID=1232801 RepID=UPI001C91DC11|nr:uncharacterized protein LOC122385551 [Amphibalanus amphitrite]
MLYDGNLYHQALKALEERFGQDDDVIQHNLNSIFDAPDPREDDAESLEIFQATVHCAVTILQNIGANADLHSSYSLQRTVEKLPRELRREWGKFSLELKPREWGKFSLELKPGKPSLLDVDAWLQTQVKISRSCPKGKQSFEEASRKNSKESAVETVSRQAFTTAARPIQKQECSLCGKHHNLDQCKLFTAKSPDARLKHVFGEQRCFRCLKKGHRVKDCRKAKRCGKNGCKYRHHALLHGGQPVRLQPPEVSTAETERKADEAVSRIRLATKQKRVVAAWDATKKTKAMLRCCK